MIAQLFLSTALALASCQNGQTVQSIRFSTEDHLRLLVAERQSSQAYDGWALAGQNLRWFVGQRVSLAEVKDHLPRALLLTERFPVLQHPKLNADDLKNLLATEAKYQHAEVETRSILRELVAKYAIPEWSIADDDLGGAFVCKNGP